MKITMYKLLGMVKDGKAPKRIRIRSAGGVYDKEFYFDGYVYMYKGEYEEYAMTDDISIEMSLNDEVEILEEEKKIPEKLNYQYRNLYGRLSQHKQSEIDIIDTLNDVIDYLKSKGE